MAHHHNVGLVSFLLVVLTKRQQQMFFARKRSVNEATAAFFLEKPYQAAI
ncbi:hypothetical protein [Lysinibacillus sphaericus]|nr:hypothetical protein [Lysinibacillus sp. SDF0037]